MSKVIIAGDASGTGTFTISSPNSNTDRTLVLPDEAGTLVTSGSTLTTSQLPAQLDISASASAGALTLDSAGRVTMPYQPAFIAYGQSGDVSFGASDTNLPLDNTLYNAGNHYNTSTKIFTAPVSGMYFFRAQIYYQGSSGNSRLRIWQNSSVSVYHIISAQTYNTKHITALVYLAANDNVKVTFQADNATNLYIANNHTNFAGYLLG